MPDFDSAFPETEQSNDFDAVFPASVEQQRRAKNYGEVSSGPVQDLIFGDTTTSPLARILDEFGQGVKDNWGEGATISKDAEDHMRKSGMWNDYDAGQKSIVKAANEVLMRGAAQTLQHNWMFRAARMGQAALGGLTETLEKEAPPVATALEAASDPGLQATLESAGPPGMIAAGIGGLLGRLSSARRLGILGEGEAGWKGVGQRKEERAEAIKPMVEEQMDHPLPGAAEESTAAEAPTPVTPPAAAAPDIHAAARQIAPETFQNYDALSARKDTMRRWITELRDTRQADAEANAPHSAEVAELNDKLADEKTTPRLAKKYQARLDAMNEERDAYIAEHTQGDSKDMATVRQRLMDTDYQMRDLAPQVAQAYRQAEATLPAQGEAGAPVAEATPTQPSEPAPSVQQPSIAQVIAGGKPAETVEQPKVIPAEAPQEPTLPTVASPSIAFDVSKKLIAAGRPAEEADAAGKLVSAYWKARAERFHGAKGDADAMYAAEGPEIKAGKEKKARQPEFAQKGKTFEQGQETPAFKEWFGDSKIVDEGGKPLVVYKAMYSRDWTKETEQGNGPPVDRIGRTTDFPAFNKDEPGIKIAGFFGDVDTAHRFLVGPDHGIFPVYLKIEKPFVVDAAGEKAGNIQFGETGRDFRDAIRSGKYDGAIIKNTADEGTIYVALKPEQIKSAIGNRGTFDPNDPRILYQEAKGRIRLRDDGRATISLLKNADASSFIHETGHEWLDRMLRDAKDDQAPADLKADADTVLKWLGADSADGLKTRHHEKFARGFETYIMEGWAPSKGLATVFAKFKDWLTTIYKTVSALKAPINDDIRAVFDRLLSSEPLQRTVIAPEREVGPSLAEKHEALAEATEPPVAHGVANTVEAERDSKSAANLLEGGDNDSRLADTGAEAERRSPGGAEPPGDANAAGSAGGEAETAGGSGAERAGGSEAPAKSLAARKEPKPHSLIEFISSRGGIRADDGNIGDLRQSIGRKNLFVPGFGQLIRVPKQLSTAAIKSGRHAALSLDSAREAAVEAGYIADNSTVPEFLELLDKELRGEKVYPHGFVPETEFDAAKDEHERERFVDDINQSIRDSGGKELTPAERARVLEISSREGLYDPAAIIERLALEADDDTGIPRAEEIPGWDVPYDAEPTSGESAGIADERPTEPSGGIARFGGEPASETEKPVTPTEPIPRSETHLIDKAGNIRLDNLGTPEDVNRVIREVADELAPYDYAITRGKVSDEQVLELADALGVTNVERLLKNRKIGEAFNAESIVAARKLLIQSASAVKDAMALAANGTDADVVAYAEARARHLMIQEQVSGITAEAGRALRAFRNLGGDHIKEAQQVTDFLRASTGKTLYQLKREAQLGLSLDTPQQISKYVLDSAKPNFGDMILEYWINGLISGPATHTTYAVGNALLALNKAGPETAAAALSNKIFQVLGKESSGIELGEVPARLYGLLKGTRDGVVAAYEAAKTARTTDLPGELEAMTADQMANSPLVNPRAAIPNFTVAGVPVPAGTLVRLPARGVAVIHSFFRAMNYASEMAGLAYRQAALEGLEGEAFARRIGEITTDPNPELMQQARASATDLTLMGKGGELTRALSRLTNAKFLGFQWLKFVDPFVHISSNVIEQSILQRTPVGILAPEIRANLLGKNGAAARDMAIGRMAVGSALGVAVGSLAAEGLVNGSGPSDPKEASIYTMVNGPPHSVRVGDTWYDIHRLGPLGMMVGITADLYEVGHKISDEDAATIAHSIAHAFTQNILDESFMRGPSDLIRALTDPDRYGKNWVKNFIASFTPYSVGMSQAARGIDPYSRQARDIISAVKAKIPWVSETLFPRRDVFGEPIPNKDALGVAGLSAIYEQKVNRDPVVRALLDAGVFPSLPERKIRGVELTEQQYDDYARIAGRTAKMRLNAIVNMPGYAQLAQGAKVDLLTHAISGARETARTLVMMQNPAIIKQAVDNKTAKIHATVH